MFWAAERNSTVVVETEVSGNCQSDTSGNINRLNCHVSGCDYRRGLDWWMDLLTTYTYDSELQAITALSLIYRLYKSLKHTQSLSLL
jgi:hypothetical protein